jgi:hypothetical protein
MGLNASSGRADPDWGIFYLLILRRTLLGRLFGPDLKADLALARPFRERLNGLHEFLQRRNRTPAGSLI